MDYFGYVYFVKRPRRIEDLMTPHTLKLKRPYRIVTEIQLPAIDYENFITDMLVLQDGLIRLAPSRWRQFRSVH